MKFKKLETTALGNLIAFDLEIANIDYNSQRFIWFSNF